jgi:hypothetical protein
VHVELDGAAFDGNALDAGAPGGIGGRAEETECLDRICIGDDDGRGDALAAVEQDAFAGNDLGNGNAGDDGCAGLAGGIAEIEG